MRPIFVTVKSNIFRHSHSFVLLSAVLMIAVNGNSLTDMNHFIRSKWCSWSSYSVCSPEKCYSGFVRRSLSLGLDDSSFITEAVDKSAYCVIRLLNNTKKKNKTLVQKSIHGRNELIVPEKRRSRTCDCQSISLLNVFRIVGRHECFPGATEYECVECAPTDPVYYYRDVTSNSDKFDQTLKIDYCPIEHGLQLHKIFGGLAGALIVICLLLCLGRIIWKYFSHATGDVGLASGAVVSSSRSAQHQRRIRAANEVLPTLSDRPTDYPALDLPPAYKDVVKIPGIGFAPVTTNVYTPDCHLNGQTEMTGFTGPTQVKTPNSRFRCSFYDDENETATSSIQILSGNQTPPPPSYEELVASNHWTNGDSSVEQIRLVRPDTSGCVDQPSRRDFSTDVHISPESANQVNRAISSSASSHE